MYNSVVFGKFMRLHSHHDCLIPEHLFTPKRKLYLLAVTPYLPLSRPLATSHVLSILLLAWPHFLQQLSAQGTQVDITLVTDCLVTVVLLGELAEGGLDDATRRWSTKCRVDSLNIVARETAAILQLFAHKPQTLLVGRDALLPGVLLLTFSMVSLGSAVKVMVLAVRAFTEIASLRLLGRLPLPRWRERAKVS